MGNTSQVGFSNATRCDVKFMVHSDKRQIVKSRQEYGGKVSAGYGGATGSVEATYKNQEEANFCLVDPTFSGFTTVSANTRLDLSDHPSLTDGSRDSYISIFIFMKDGSIIQHTSNLEVGTHCNRMLGETKEGKFEFVQLHPQRTWRAKGSNGTQNYYGRKCNGCGEVVACKPGCSDLAEFGGHHK